MFKLKNKLNSEILKSALEGKDIATYGGKAIKQQLKRILVRSYLQYEKDEGYQHSSDEVERRASKVIEHYSPTIMEVVSGSYNYIKYGSIVAPPESESGKSVPGKGSSMTPSDSTSVEGQLNSMLETGPPKDDARQKEEETPKETSETKSPKETGGDFELNM